MNRDFQRIYRRGKQAVYNGLVVYVMPTKRGKPRMGITAGGKIGNAVKRNRAKRVIRAAFSCFEQQIDKSCDIILVARVRTTLIKSTDVFKMMEKAFKELGIIK